MSGNNSRLPALKAAGSHTSAKNTVPYTLRPRVVKTEKGTKRKSDDAFAENSAPSTSRQSAFSSILRGTRSQSSPAFRDNAGRQCVANCAMAYRVSLLGPLARWTSEWIDLSLRWGNEYYNEMALRLGTELHESGQLQIRQLAERSAHFDDHLEVKDSGIPCLFQLPEGNEADFVTPKTALEQFFQQSNQGIILATEYARAIFKVEETTTGNSSPHFRYYLFDPHGISANGLPADDTGKAALMAFDSIDRLAEHYDRMVRKTWSSKKDGPLEQITVELASLEFVVHIDE